MKTLYFLFLLFSQVAFGATSDGGKPSMKNAMRILNGFCSFIPSGHAVVNKDTFSVQAFYISSTEITNLQYLEFLYELRKKGEVEKLKVAQLDTLCWRLPPAYGEAYVQYYHQHPAYRDYPVVGVSKEGAELFCQWLTQKYDSLSNGEMRLKFRLPTQAEWLRAARGDQHDQTYAWVSEGIRDEEGKIQANFFNMGAENISRNPSTGEFEIVRDAWIDFSGNNADVTVPAESYSPNEFGLYNLNGNVAEMLQDVPLVIGGDWRSPGYDIRNESTRPYQGTEATVGFRVVATYLSN